ncbi:alpha/beta hydrolase [Streptomyces tagetis]|uniref:Alpha/beta hydrolase n=1 Tax=Streptomyces tagetis TaxID=2820809 RepID=A0A940XKX1_9ACTN|nr:alpha/beta hydrolase [Streptomyces sp. RG38]MBQ0826550.1 alpha/beta hydrolase [Streptomyces sp. RG38]
MSEPFRPRTAPATARAEVRTWAAREERAAAGREERSALPAARVRSERRAALRPALAPGAVPRTVPGRSGPVTVRVLPPPARPRGLYVHLHGGGWTLGAADEQDDALLRLSAATGLRAVSVEYRLAPEHPWPAAPRDCEDVARWLLRHGPAELGTPARWVIGGESAGAHLAVLTLLALRERPEAAGAFHAACLAYGWYDLGLTPSARQWRRPLVLSPADLAWFLTGFLPGRSAERRRGPEVSPLYAPLDGLCPAHFTVGTEDPLLDDTLFLATRWRAAGNPAVLDVWPDAPHGFLTRPFALARLAEERRDAFLAPLLG